MLSSFRKVINKSQQTSIFLRLFCEVHRMKGQDHTNIKMLQVTDTPKTLCLASEDISGGDIFAYLLDHGCMTEEESQGKF